jgi:predicted nucleotide-binding protein (sugar kinase/HSP70/actin superfamily)
MGSVEVYDYQQMKWVPYVSTPEDADIYYQRMRDRIDPHVRSTISKTLRDTEDKLKETENKLKRMEERTPAVNQVTDVAGAIERAQSEVKRERKKGRERKKVTLPKGYRKLTY